MFIENKVITVKVGNSDKMIEKFSQGKMMQLAEGFIENTILKRVRKNDTEEIMIMTRWETQQDFTNWKKSDAHKAGHSQKKDQILY